MRSRSMTAYARAFALVPLLHGCALPAGPGLLGGPTPPPDYRIYDTRAERFLGIGELGHALASSDVVLFGEFHDDAVAHRVQLRLLEELASASGDGVLGLEMFERDVQPELGRYTAGRVDEADFLSVARPWPNYPTDYRPLVEAARRLGWRVVATNLPQRHASLIAREGIEGLDRLPLDERRLAAAEIVCPEDDYWLKFVEALSDDSESPGDAPAHIVDSPVLRRTYQAQCARDDTMAEAIVENLEPGPILHINGAFHSDDHLGIVPRILRRAPDAVIRVLSAQPVPDLSRPPLAEHIGRADYIVFTQAPPEGE